MAKQKVVLKLYMEDAKKRAKAMKCVVGLHGVESASREGDKITVVGEGVDCVALTTLLRKKMGKMGKMGYVELLTVAAVDEKKEVKVEAGAKSVQQIAWPTYYGGDAVAQPPYYSEFRNTSYDESSCCIM